MRGKQYTLVVCGVAGVGVGWLGWQTHAYRRCGWPQLKNCQQEKLGVNSRVYYRLSYR